MADEDGDFLGGMKRVERDDGATVFVPGYSEEDEDEEETDDEENEEEEEEAEEEEEEEVGR